MSIKHAQRQARYVERREATGQKRCMFWMTPEEKEYIKTALDNYRNGVGNDDSHIIYEHADSINKQKKTLADKILHGLFTYYPPVNKRYVVDHNFTNPSYWNNVLPDAKIIVMDSHKRVKECRGVALRGLGAFPVIWSICYALRRQVLAQQVASSPRKRGINLLRVPFEDIIVRIVGQAKMSTSDEFKDTPLGFLCHPVSIEPIRVPKSMLDEEDQSLLVLLSENGKLLKTNALIDKIEDITSWHFRPPMVDGNMQMYLKWYPIMQSLTALFDRPTVIRTNHYL